MGRAEAFEELYAVLVGEQGSALLHGEPGGGKSTIALKLGIGEQRFHFADAGSRLSGAPERLWSRAA